MDTQRALDAALGGLIGVRAVYVAIHWRYYSDHVSQALALWNGGPAPDDARGLAWHGALLGGLIALRLYCAVHRCSPGAILDVLTPGAVWLTICAWVGCLLSGCAYGVETYPDQGWLWRLGLYSAGSSGLGFLRGDECIIIAGWRLDQLADGGLLALCGLLGATWVIEQKNQT
ncbi:MAG TPA: hypothetical protein ENN99_05055 [Chloroflexi bacterium]|nr:hypothetical protein [Chloroflexota bacterium]